MVSTLGSIIRRESRLSRVPPFFLLDELVLLSSDVDNEPALDPVETEGDRAAEEDNFVVNFLVETLLTVLSNDEEALLLAEESDGDDNLAEVFLTDSWLLASELTDALGVFVRGEIGTDLLVSDVLDRVVVLALLEGNVLFRISGRDRLIGSAAKELLFLAVPEPTLVPLGRLVTVVGCFSGKPPVLFLLGPGGVPEIREVLLKVDFVRVDLTPLELESVPSVIPVFLFAVPTFVAPFWVVELGLTLLEDVFTLSANDCFSNSDLCGCSTKSCGRDGFSIISEVWLSSTESSVDMKTWSPIRNKFFKNNYLSN